MTAQEMTEPARFHTHMAEIPDRVLPRGFLAVYGVELRKLMSQTKVRVVTVILLLAPWIAITLIVHQSRLPVETLYGRYLTTTGLATPMFVLVTAVQWIFPLVAAFVSGDIFSADDGHGTYKTILTRSVSRRAVFWGKVTAGWTFTALIVVAMALSSLAAGLVLVGHQPFITVGAETITAGRGAVLVLLAWVSVIPAVLAFSSMAMLVSVATRNSVLGVVLPVVVGLLFQMYSFLNAWDTVRHLLLNWAMNGWRGILDSPARPAELERGLLVSLVYIIVLIVPAYVVFRRRDMTGG